MSGFSKSERLCSRQQIDRLYEEGHRLMAFPFSVQWMVADDNGDLCKMMVVAPKRRFKHAVDRNRVRRLSRECYRQRKEAFYAFLRQQGVNIVLSLVYVHNEIMTYDQLSHKMDKLFAALEKDITEKIAK